jgi:hypothetical protein
MASQNTGQMPPIPFKYPISDQSGNLSQTWYPFFRQLFARIGGEVAPSNSENNNQITAIQTSLANLQTEIDGINQGPVL